jgi:hypothetical protein
MAQEKATATRRRTPASRRFAKELLPESTRGSGNPANPPKRFGLKRIG